MNRKAPVFLVLLAGMLFLASCKSTRVAYKAPLKEEGPEYLYQKLKENEFQFDWFSARIDASYQEKKSYNEFNGQIRIRKDSLIWVTISPALGIEMIRVMITTDSVKYVNRFAKEYFTGDYALLSKFLQIDIDFDILQALLIGNDFQFYENNTFRADVDFPEYRLSTTGRGKIRKEAEITGTDPIVLLQNIWLDPETFKITRFDLKEYMKENRKLDAYYGDFIKTDGERYPTSLQFNIVAEDIIKMQVNYGRVTVNEPLSFPFSIPGNYKRIW